MPGLVHRTLSTLVISGRAASGAEHPDPELADDSSDERDGHDTAQEASTNVWRGAFVDARARVDTDPTESQRDAGNFRKGHVYWKGLDLSIEYPLGSTRRGKSPDGSEWSRTMTADYGYFKRTKGKDGDNLDFYFGPDHESEFVYVVNQVRPDSGRFDEHKVILGCRSVREARELYLSHYPDGWKGLESGRAMTLDEFRDWMSGDLSKRADEMVGRVAGWVARASKFAGVDWGRAVAWYEPDTDHLWLDRPHELEKLAGLVSRLTVSPECPDISSNSGLRLASSDGLWLKTAESQPRTLLKNLGWIPGESGLGRFASPMTAMLATGALGAGLGYGGGWLMERALPDRWDRGRLSRTLALLGGLGGAAAPAVMLGLPNVDHGRSLWSAPVITEGPEDRVELGPDGLMRMNAPESTAGLPESTKSGEFSSGLGGPPPEIDVDRFVHTLWSDPDVARRVPPDIQAAATGLLRAARRPDSPTVGMADIGRIAAGMGAGWFAGAAVGKALGLLTGMPEDTQATLRRTGVWAGIVNQMVPRAFGVGD